MIISSATSSNQLHTDLGAYFRSRAFWAQLALFFCLILAVLWSLSVGAVSIHFDVIINTLLDLEGDKQTYIILKSRLPRTLLAILTGGALAISGAIIQAIIRNPLASPKIIGINSGAALFVCLLVIFFPNIPVAYLPVSACLGGVLAGLATFVGAQRQKLSGMHLALVGIAVGFVCESVVDYILIVSPTYQVSSPLIWLTGSLWGRNWSHVYSVSLPLIILMISSLVMAYRLDILHLGNETATGLGLNVSAQRLVLLLLATLLASVAVSAAGVLGFVGLMAPHIARKLVGGSHRLNIPTAGLIGMLLVVLADGMGRALAPPIEISAGILTAVLGAPFFIYLMMRTGRA